MTIFFAMVILPKMGLAISTFLSLISTILFSNPLHYTFQRVPVFSLRFEVQFNLMSIHNLQNFLELTGHCLYGDSTVHQLGYFKVFINKCLLLLIQAILFGNYWASVKWPGMDQLIFTKESLGTQHSKYGMSNYPERVDS